MALEGTCKMLFAPQFCEETSDGDYIEAVLAHLILKATVSDAEAGKIDRQWEMMRQVIWKNI